MILYNVEPISAQTSAYQQSDPPSANLRRDSAELFVKEIIPPLQLVLVILYSHMHIYIISLLLIMKVFLMFIKESRSVSLGRCNN